MDFSKIYKIEAISASKNIVTLKIFLSTYCNYNCSYCIQKKFREKIKNKKLTDNEITNSINILIEKLKELNIENMNISLSLIGGEISFFNIKSLVIEPLLKNKFNITKIIITSNFSNNIDWYLDLYNFLYLKNIKLSYTFSFYEEFADENKFLEKLNKLYMAVDKKYCTITIETVINNNNFNIIKNFYNKYCKIILHKDRRFLIDLDVNTKNINTGVYNFVYNTNTSATFNKTLVVYQENEKPIKINRVSLLSDSPIGFPSKGFLCKNRYKNLQFFCDKNKLVTKCSISTLNECICDKDYCRLCTSPVDIEKINHKN